MSAQTSSIPRRVWGGTGLLIAGRLYGSLCTFVVLYVLAHHLPAEAFGRYTFYLAVFVLLDTLADFGTGSIAVQRTAHDANAVPEVLAATRRIRLGMGAIGFVLAGGGALVLGESGAWWIVLASLYPLTHVFELSLTVFKNRISWSMPVLVRAIATSASLAFVLTLVQLGDREPAHMLLATALGSTLGNGLLWWACRKHLPTRAAERIPLAEMFRAALPLGVASLCQQAYFYIDNLFVRAWCGPEELGHYNIAVRVLSILIMAALYATQAAMPWLVREHHAGRLGASVVKLAQPLFALAGFGCGLLAPWTETLLSLFGERFAGAGPTLRWLLGAVTAIYAGAALMTALVAAGRSRSILAVAATALLVNVIANFALVPRLGIEGAGIATLATESFVVVAGLVLLRRARIDVFGGARAVAWLGGPLGFAFGWWMSAQLPVS
ncbi:MAG: oligosaccharide flippase family protein [Planctomycetota bacterium]|nr:oligosaccharide flippase family protein [Planctomycetota bacterium]